ncbi:hypothetical protein I4U23_021288 [Adineta vaga]|nr:hypothetical protein I4U23_021288 [Adineta vaga]
MSMNETLQVSLIHSTNSTIFVEELLQKIILGCVLSSLSVFTVCGNILVLYAIQTEKYLRTVSNLFILSLAIADLAVGLFVMPLNAANIITGRWPFSSAICQMWLSIDYVASTASIFNLVLLSLDRYWAVVYPLRYLQKRTRRRATIFILSIWFISLLWAPAIIFWSDIAPELSDIIKNNECDTSFRSNKTFKTLTALVNFYLPLLTMIIISCRIMVAIRSRSKMELGRRLSSATQKKMKYDRTFTSTVSRIDNDTIQKTDNGDIQLVTPTIVINPLESSINTETNFIDSIEPGQCFCSTCRNIDKDVQDNLWQLQKKPVSSASRGYYSYIPMKFIDKVSTKTTTISIKDDKNYKSQDFTEKSNPIKKSVSVSENMKYLNSMNINNRLKKKLSSMQKDHSIHRTFSATSTSSSEQYSETKSPETRPKKTKMTLSQSLLNHSLPNESHLKIQKPSNKTSVATLNNHSPINTNILKRKKMNFFNALINPSRSSSLQKELKAARQLGILVGVFTITWLPYFILFLVVAWCNDCISERIYTASIWLGYLNSTVNPLIYPLCNAHFRRAFQKICYCKHAKTTLPNLNALRELHALHSRRRQR